MGCETDVKQCDELTESLEEGMYRDIRSVVVDARHKVQVAVNAAMVEAYWEIGKHIVDAAGERATRNSGFMRRLSERLTAEFGKGFTERNLRAMRQFYEAFPNRHTLCADISWSHYRLLIRLDDPDERSFYLRLAVEERLSVRELGEQIERRAYWRTLSTQKAAIEQEGTECLPMAISPADNVFKDPYVLDFLDLSKEELQLESSLEQALIDSLEKFLLELGRGFTFYARQKRVTDNGDHYYIDLVFYNYVLNCFVLIDLKTRRITPQDIGQMDFYTRLFDGEYKASSMNPTVGIVLGTEKTRAVARYTAVADGDRLYAAQYMTELPTEEELAVVLERNRRELEAAQTARALEGLVGGKK